MELNNRIKKTICPYDCPTSCGFLAETDGQRILAVKGDPDHPVTKGIICRKMSHYEKSIHSTKRILKPLRRTGSKGAGRFEEITWEEAIAEIADKWKQIIRINGPEYILPVTYSGVMSVIQRQCGDAFFNRMGACRLIKTLCSTAKGVGYQTVMGKTGCLDPRELKDSDYYIIWGSNMQATRLQDMPGIVQARKDGKKILLIESYAEKMWRYCDETILIKPGTDGALALAMMHVLEREGLADEEFLRREAEGYEEFKQTLAAYTPEWAEEITGVNAEVIVRIAREYSGASAPAIILGSGNSRYGNGAMTVRLITILSAFTGAWAKPGGGLCGCSPSTSPCVDINRVQRKDFRTNNPRDININQVATALTGSNGQEPVKSIYVYGGNPASSVSNQRGVLAGLKNDELFTVVHERFMTDTAKYADIILPATFSVEQSDCYLSYGYSTFGVAKKLVPPAGECRSNWDTFCLLAEAMGYEEDYFKRTEDEMLEELLNNPLEGLASVTEEERADIRKGGVISLAFADHCSWDTPTKKIQIVNPALTQPMPRYTESHGGNFPLRLIAVPSAYTLNSIFHERDDLVNRRGEMKLAIHPRDAAQRNIVDGARIIACNDLAEVEFIADVTDKVAPGTVAAVGVYSAEHTLNGLSVNALHHERLSDMGEATTMNDNTVEVKAMK